MSDLVWSIKNGDLEQVKDFVEHKKIDINQEYDGRSLLHYAADFGQSEVVEYLIKHGADVNALDKHGISSILAAIWEGHTQCVKLLIEGGATKTGKAPDGTPYLDNCEKNDIRTLLEQN
uniref:Putative myotrophin n=1 Tax=Corethrella appendiculata TaxID=1370023 RepID=U5EYL7_9DIPT